MLCFLTGPKKLDAAGNYYLNCYELIPGLDGFAESTRNLMTPVRLGPELIDY